MMTSIPNLDELIRMALLEDVGDGDHSTLSCIPPTATNSAKMVAKQEGIVCGMEVGERVFHFVNDSFYHTQIPMKVTLLKKDGTAGGGGLDPGLQRPLPDGEALLQTLHQRRQQPDKLRQRVHALPGKQNQRPEQQSQGQYRAEPRRRSTPPAAASEKGHRPFQQGRHHPGGEEGGRPGQHKARAQPQRAHRPRRRQQQGEALCQPVRHRGPLLLCQIRQYARFREKRNADPARKAEYNGHDRETLPAV